MRHIHPVLMSEQEKSKLKQVMELARQGFNHLACLDLKARTRDKDLLGILKAFYRDNSPSRWFAAQLVLSLRKRDGIGLKPSFKQLGRALGVIHLNAGCAELRGNQLTVMSTLNLVIDSELISKGDLAELHLELDETGDVSVRAVFKPALDIKGSSVRPYKKNANSLSALNKRAKARSK